MYIHTYNVWRYVVENGSVRSKLVLDAVDAVGDNYVRWMSVRLICLCVTCCLAFGDIRQIELSSLFRRL